MFETLINLDQKKTRLEWHENFIVHLASILKPNIYVELGLYRCKLFNRIIPYANNLIGVDIAPETKKYISHSPKVTFINDTTNNYASMLKKQPITIDLLFIDANHSKKSVLSDFSNFFPFVSDHGIIVLHDSFPIGPEETDPGYSGDGYKAIEQLAKKTDTYEMMTIPVHPGLTLCRKRTSQLAWQEKK